MKRAGAAMVVVALCACEQLAGIDGFEVRERGRIDDEPTLDGSAADDSGATVDASKPDSADAAAPTDTGVIDTKPASCTALPTNEAFVASPAAPWVLMGDATHAAPGVRLTPSMGAKTGLLYWDAAHTFDRLDVTFAYVITTDAASSTFGPGDGLAFAWISSAAVPAIGGSGGGLGVRGHTGWAVAVDTYQNAEYMDAPTPNISIKNTLDMTNIASSNVNAALIDGAQHIIRARLANGSVSVMLDGVEVIGATALPGYTAFSGYFGFGAGTGGAFEDHKLTAVTARIGTFGPCAAP